MTLAQIRNTKVVELLSTVIDNLVQGQLNTWIVVTGLWFSMFSHFLEIYNLTKSLYISCQMIRLLYIQGYSPFQLLWAYKGYSGTLTLMSQITVFHTILPSLFVHLQKGWITVWTQRIFTEPGILTCLYYLIRWTDAVGNVSRPAGTIWSLPAEMLHEDCFSDGSLLPSR